MTISNNDFIIFIQFKIRRKITLRGCRVRGGSNVHVPWGVRLSKVESAESISNVSWARSVDIESSLLRFRSKNSTLLCFRPIIRLVPVWGWVRPQWIIRRIPLLPRWDVPWLPLLLWLSAVSSPRIAASTVVFLAYVTTVIGIRWCLFGSRWWWCGHNFSWRGFDHECGWSRWGVRVAGGTLEHGGFF